MSNPKERHYWAQLRTALTAGQWRSHSPAKAPNGASLSWSELFRKFNKHCRGAHDVACAASHTYTLALSISEDSSNDDDDNDISTLGVDAECLVSQRRTEQIQAGYEELKSLQASNLDTIHFALAYYAYALGNPAQCIAHLDKVPELHQVRSHVPTSLGATLSSTNLLTPATDHADYAPSVASSFAHSFTSIVESTVPEVRDGRGLAMTESFRSICLQGMALERLHPNCPLIALQTYRSVLPHLFPSLKSQFTHKSLHPTHNHKLSSSSTKPDFIVFHQLRELWRWVERIIWRAVILCASVCDVRKGWNGDEENSNSNEQHSGEEADSLWIWLSHYTYYKAYWPSTFRTSHRSTIASIHLRALILLHRPSSSLPIPPSPSQPSLSIPPPKPPTKFRKSPPAWLDQARLVIQDYQSILAVSTTFPRAGTRNMKVEEFVDLCVAVWEMNLFSGGGGQVGWVVDILWWATRLTFNSSRVLRHMTRLLCLSGDTKLAKRTLNLYIQVVGKAYETNGHVSVGSSSGSEERAEDMDTDTDSNWVDTLIFGAIMLCKSSSSHSFPYSSNLNEMDELNEAHQIIEKAKTRLNKQDKRLVAKICLAEGVYWMMLGVKGQDPLARPMQLSLSHSLLLQSVQTDPTPSAYYHLALSYSIPGSITPNKFYADNSKYDLHEAIQYAGLAVEADPGDVKHWHFLGLLLAAQERWEEAMEILERGADLGVNDDDGVEGSGKRSPSMETGDGDEDDTIETVQADIRTLLGPPISTHDPATSDSSTTPTIKINGVGNVATNCPSPTTKKVNNNLPPQPLYILSQSQFLSPSAITCIPSLPPASSLLLTPPPARYPPSPYDLFESHLQLRMTQGTVIEIVEGAESVEALWLEVFGWIAEKRTTAALPPSYLGTPIDSTQMYQTQIPVNESSDLETNTSIMDPIPITISPATPIVSDSGVEVTASGADALEKGNDQGRGKEKRTLNNSFQAKRSTSIDIESNRLDVNKSKKNVSQMLKGSVMKSRAGITAATKKLGHGVVRHGGLRRSTSTPDFHAVFQQQSSYQASSIHSRRRLSFMSASRVRHLPSKSPTPPPPPVATTQRPPSTSPTPMAAVDHQDNDHSIGRNRLLSDLWLMSSATFRRLGKIEQAKGAIQEAEVKDENNPAVWVQFGLYYIAIGMYQHAVDTFQKALFICPDDVAATVHLSRLYLDPDLEAHLHPSVNATTTSSEGESTTDSSNSSTTPPNSDVDLAAGMLSYLTKGKGWNVPEAWYYLAKAYGLQGREEEEKEILKLALELSERRGVRDIGSALGWCYL